MEEIIAQHFANLRSKDAHLRYASFEFIMTQTREKVNWAYEVWDDLLDLTRTGDNHQRTIGVQVLSNLAKSDPKQRMLKDFEQLLVVTKDDKFVTARHSLQSLWKIAIVSKDLETKVVESLTARYNECVNEKNGTLIRYDILEVFRKIYDRLSNDKLKARAVLLIEAEDDAKYRKKYMGLWKDLLKLT
ncbi:hypothetical protein [Segetibacter aerophilus]|uniref:DNA alkylation repair protein n=1 Tax=Segetibacter aerophilus TaxID=670293 RepID=A0A512BHT3_9BACT|nr:hypothetical protein [Segetibacter aerophilus]GEO11521.1 hypothetical protein SAE01_40170 [Segetibacter aerophilus]